MKVLIDGVNLQVGPLNVAALDKEETKKRVISAKMAKLRMVDRFIDFSSGSSSSSSNSNSSSTGNPNDDENNHDDTTPEKEKKTSNV